MVNLYLKTKSGKRVWLGRYPEKMAKDKIARLRGSNLWKVLI